MSIQFESDFIDIDNSWFHEGGGCWPSAVSGCTSPSTLVCWLRAVSTTSPASESFAVISSHWRSDEVWAETCVSKLRMDNQWDKSLMTMMTAMFGRKRIQIYTVKYCSHNHHNHDNRHTESNNHEVCDPVSCLRGPRFRQLFPKIHLATAQQWRVNKDMICKAFLWRSRDTWGGGNENQLSYGDVQDFEHWSPPVVA